MSNPTNHHPVQEDTMQLIKDHNETGPETVVVKLDQNDLHNLIGAMYNYRSSKINLMGSPFELRLRDLINDLRSAEKELHDQQARARGLIVEGDEPFVGGAF